MRIVPKNWRDFQHYKNRNPPWIRLHRNLLDNKDFHRLPVASRALAPMLWLLASESVDGSIDADPDNLAFRLRASEKDIASALRPLLEHGFFVVEQGDSAVLAPCTEKPPISETEALQRQRHHKGVEEKRDPAGFAEFWNAWPKSERKQDRAKCAEKWRTHKLGEELAVILMDIDTKKRTEKWRSGYIEAPEVYLNNRRWEDGVTPDSKPATVESTAADETAARIASERARSTAPPPEHIKALVSGAVRRIA